MFQAHIGNINEVLNVTAQHFSTAVLKRGGESNLNNSVELVVEEAAKT